MKRKTTKQSLVMMVALVLGALWASPAMAQSGLDQELEEYWATERDLNVLEDRLFNRADRFSAGLYVGLANSEPLFKYYPVGLRAGYSFSNNLSLEVSGAFMDADMLTRDTELSSFLRTRDQYDPARHSMDRYKWRSNAMALWSPFYGKVAALQQKLIHFEINLGAGLGVVSKERPTVDRSDAESVVRPEVALGVGAHFYIGQDWVVRIDGRGFLNQGAELPTQDGFFERMAFPLEANFGFSYLF